MKEVDCHRSGPFESDWVRIDHNSFRQSYADAGKGLERGNNDDQSHIHRKRII
jgi:hypothetical protein